MARAILGPKDPSGQGPQFKLDERRVVALKLQMQSMSQRMAKMKDVVAHQRKSIQSC